MVRLTIGNRKWWILATMTPALSTVLIDETVVGVALPAGCRIASSVALPGSSMRRAGRPVMCR